MLDFFSTIISPYTIDDFFTKYHEKDILHIIRNDAQFYTSILTAKDISNFLDRQDTFYPSLRIVKDGKEIPSAEYTLKGVPIGHHSKDGIINTEKAFNLFNNGSTFVIQAGQRYFENLSACCMALSQKFNAPVQANLYITPNESKGFNPHWDTHDVFVLQISGTKTWNLYGFEKELPTKSQHFVSKGYDKAPLQTMQLSPGDFLYIPRGYVHDAVADDGISAHITIGILSFTWARYFAELFTQLEDQKAFREAVPFWKNDLNEQIQQKVNLLRETIEKLDYNMGVEKLHQQYYNAQPQLVSGYFESLLQLNKISEHTIFACNKNIFYQFKEIDEKFIIKCFGKQITIPLMQKPVIDYIFGHENFSLQVLPGYKNTALAKDLIRQLIKEGVVYICQQ